MSGPFIAGFAHNMEAAAQQQNMVAIAATAVTIVRVLVPMAGRFVWHWWNKGTDEVTEDKDAESVVIPDALVELLAQKQQQLPQQQPQSPSTPSGPEKRTRISPLYSNEPLNGNLLLEFGSQEGQANYCMYIAVH